MILHYWVRQSHRWLGVLLILTMLVNFVSMTFGPTPLVIVYAPLLPLSLLVFSGLYMFLLPHLGKSNPQSARDNLAAE